MEPKTELSEGQEEPKTAPDSEGVRTLFISGLPADVRSREVYNLFRLQSGFQHTVLNNKGKVPVGFAVFDNQANALHSKEIFHGLRFDPDSKQELRVELARSNSYMKNRKRAAGDDGSVISLLPSSPGIITIHPPAGFLDKRMRGGSGSVRPTFRGERSKSNSKKGDAPRSGAAAGTSCTTLFIANLPPSTTEDEMRLLLSSQPGYRRHRFSNTRGTPVCFVDFHDENLSGNALSTLQGHTLHPGDSGMRVEFAKSAMNGKPRSSGSPEFSGGGHPSLSYGTGMGGGGMHGPPLIAHPMGHGHTHIPGPSHLTMAHQQPAHIPQTNYSQFPYGAGVGAGVGAGGGGFGGWNGSSSNPPSSFSSTSPFGPGPGVHGGYQEHYRS